MLEHLQAFFSSSEAVGVAVLGMILGAYKAAGVLSNAMDLHEQHFVRKRHKRLMEFKVSVDDAGPFAPYFNEAIQLEAFRKEFGIHTSPLKARALLKLWKSGHWERNQLSQISRYLSVHPTDNTFTIEISRLDKFGARLAMVATLGMVIFGGILWIALSLSSKTPTGYFIGMFVFLAFLLSGRLFAPGFGRYRNAQRAQRYIQHQGDDFRSISNWPDHQTVKLLTQSSVSALAVADTDVHPTPAKEMTTVQCPN